MAKGKKFERVSPDSPDNQLGDDPRPRRLSSEELEQLADNFNDNDISEPEPRKMASAESTHVYKIEPKIEEATIVKGEFKAAAEAEKDIPDSAAVPRSPFDDAMLEAYHNALDKEIKKGMIQIHERYVRLISQENPARDKRPARDELRNTSDWYYNLYYAIKDGAEPGTKEQIYQKLYDLKFTGMRPLAAIQQEYPLSL